jgi:hypothetical protein
MTLKRGSVPDADLTRVDECPHWDMFVPTVHGNGIQAELVKGTWEASREISIRKISIRK